MQAGGWLATSTRLFRWVFEVSASDGLVGDHAAGSVDPVVGQPVDKAVSVVLRLEGGAAVGSGLAHTLMHMPRTTSNQARQMQRR